jgi:hypothetical protein
VKDKIRETLPAVIDVMVHVEPLGFAARKAEMEHSTSNIQHPTSS